MSKDERESLEEYLKAAEENYHKQVEVLDLVNRLKPKDTSTLSAIWSALLQRTNAVGWKMIFPLRKDIGEQIHNDRISVSFVTAKDEEVRVTFEKKS